jgi:hypothetical protein
MVDLGFADGSVLTTTDGHPFWNASTGEFTDAIDLEAGELVLTLDGQALEIASVQVYGEDLTAYNLEIEGIHTYYAGETPVLVHNSCGDSAELIYESNPKHQANSYSSSNGVVSRAPRCDCQAMLECSVSISSKQRRGVEPATGLTVSSDCIGSSMERNGGMASSQADSWRPVFPEPAPLHWVAIVGRSGSSVEVLSDAKLGPEGVDWLARWLGAHRHSAPEAEASYVYLGLAEGYWRAPSDGLRSSEGAIGIGSGIGFGEPHAARGSTIGELISRGKAALTGLKG